MENSVEIGTLIIKNPFIEESNKILPVFKDINEVEFGYNPPDAKAKILSGSSPITAEYTV